MLSQPTFTSPAELIQLFKNQNLDVSSFVGDVVQKDNSVGNVANNIDEALRTLQHDLHQEVVLCHEKLLDNTFNLELLDKELTEVRENVNGLKSSMDVIKHETLIPFRDMKRKVGCLSRAQKLNILVRKCRKFEQDMSRLKAHFGASQNSQNNSSQGGNSTSSTNTGNNNSAANLKDYSKITHTLFEVEQLLTTSPKIDDVKSLRADVLWVNEQSRVVRERANEDLKQGLVQGNKELIITAAQAFFNLDCLWEKIQLILREILQNIDNELNVLLVPPKGQQNYEIVEPFILRAQSACRRVRFLDECLADQIDSVSHEKFSAEWQDSSIFSLFWEKLWTATFAGKIAQMPATMRNLLVSDFTKLSKLLQVQLIDELNVSQFVLQRQMVKGVEELHLAFDLQSRMRVNEPVEFMFPELKNKDGSKINSQLMMNQQNLPTVHDLKRFIEVLSAEVVEGEASANFLLN